MKFLHVGDMHLGAEPDKDSEWSKTRQQEIWDSFANIIDICNEEHIDLLLLTGDIFHSQPLVRQLKDFDYRLSNLKETRVVMITGNHDFIKDNNKYGNYEWNPKVTMLSSKELESVYYEELNVEVYGFSYHSREIIESKLDGVKPADKSRINVLLAHGGDEKHMPINYKSLQYAGFNYIGLGHIHLPQIIIPNMVAYAGILEPIDKCEIGDRGYIRGTILDNKTEITFVKSNKRSYLEKVLKITPTMTNAEIQDVIKNTIQESGTENFYIIKLKGYRDPETEIDCDRLYELGYIVEVDDQTEPDYDFDMLYEVNKDNMIGMFIGELLPEAKAGKEMEKKALYYGLRALLAAKEV